MSASDRTTATATWARILAVALILIALALAGGPACGGDNVEGESPSSQSSDRESPGIAGTGNDEEDDDDNDVRESSGSDAIGGIEKGGSAASGGGVSIRGLESVPNLLYDRVALVDVVALRSGEVPKEIATLRQIREAWLALAEALGSSEDAPIEMSMTDLETFIFMEWYESYERGGAAFTIQGKYSVDSVRSSLDATRWAERIEEAIDYEAWEYYDETVAIVQDRVYGVDEYFEDSRLFLDPLVRGDRLLAHSDNPMVRAFEKLGPGWLVYAQTDWCHIRNLGNDCLVSAFSASAGSEAAVEATWLLLFENSGDAKAAKRSFDEHVERLSIEGSSSWDNVSYIIEPHWITQVDTDGEFLVFEASLPLEEAVELFEDMLYQLEHPDP